MSVNAFFQKMPKVELHIHLEGAIEAATLLRLAETFGLTEDDLQQLVLNAVRSTFLPAEEMRRMEAEFVEQFAALSV